jgi:hypothetical protein
LPAKLIELTFRNIISIEDLHLHQPVIFEIKSKQVVSFDHIGQFIPFNDPLPVKPGKITLDIETIINSPLSLSPEIDQNKTSTPAMIA